MKSGEIRCPCCDEVIREAAKKCKHCGEWLEPARPDASSPPAASIPAGPPHDPKQKRVRRRPSRVSETEVTELLTSLVSRCLVVFDETTGRYRLLETVRQYSRDRLLETEAGERWRGRHLEYFLALGEEAEPKLTGSDQQSWLERLEAEHDNLRSVLEWSAGSNSEAGLKLAGALWRFWYVRGYFGEGSARLAELLPVADPDWRTSERARAIHGAGVLACEQGDYVAARAHHEESLAIRRELGDQLGIAGSLNNLGGVAHSQGDYTAARALFEESLEVFRKQGDPLGIGSSLNNLGLVAHDQGDYAAARAFHEEFLAIIRELGDRQGIAVSLGNLGRVAYEQGDSAAARALHEESLAIVRELGDRQGIAYSLNNLGSVGYQQGDFAAAATLYGKSLAIKRELGDRWGTAWSLEGLAAAEAARGRVRRAGCLWGAAERLREEIGSPLPPNERPRYEQQVAAARAALGDDVAVDAAWKKGRAMTLEQAIELALGEADG